MLFAIPVPVHCPFSSPFLSILSILSFVPVHCPLEDKHMSIKYLCQQCGTRIA